MDWFRQIHETSNNISNIWKVVVNALPLLRQGIMWRINEGNDVHIGTDPWVGCGNAHRLPVDLIRFLNSRGITHIKHIGDRNNSIFLQQAWKAAHDLDIIEQW